MTLSFVTSYHVFTVCAMFVNLNLSINQFIACQCDAIFILLFISSYKTRISMNCTGSLPTPYCKIFVSQYCISFASGRQSVMNHFVYNWLMDFLIFLSELITEIANRLSRRVINLNRGLYEIRMERNNPAILYKFGIRDDGKDSAVIAWWIRAWRINLQ